MSEANLHGGRAGSGCAVEHAGSSMSMDVMMADFLAGSVEWGWEILLSVSLR